MYMYLDREVDGEPADHAIRVCLRDNACNIIARLIIIIIIVLNITSKKDMLSVTH